MNKTAAVNVKVFTKTQTNKIFSPSGKPARSTTKFIKTITYNLKQKK